MTPQEESKCKNAQFLQWILKDDDVYFQKITASSIWGNSFIVKNIGFLHIMLLPQYCVTVPQWVKLSSCHTTQVRGDYIISHPVNFDIQREISLKCYAKNWTYIYTYIDITLLIILMGFIYRFNYHTFYSLFSMFKNMFFKIFKSWQVCDWLAKWFIIYDLWI